MQLLKHCNYSDSFQIMQAYCFLAASFWREGLHFHSCVGKHPTQKCSCLGGGLLDMTAAQIKTMK